MVGVQEGHFQGSFLCKQVLELQNFLIKWSHRAQTSVSVTWPTSENWFVLSGPVPGLLGPWNFACLLVFTIRATSPCNHSNRKKK